MSAVRFAVLSVIFFLLFSLSLANEIPTDDRSIIEEMISQVDQFVWLETLTKLVENGGYESRFSQRVDEYDQIEGQPTPDRACDHAADWIAEQLASFGLEVEKIPFEHRVVSISGEVIGEYTMHNVVGILPGSGANAGSELLITAHYDSIASEEEGWDQNWNTIPAPGATDNGSGTTALIETARILSRYRFDHTIRFVAFSGEELGLFGSKNYSEIAAESGANIVGVLNLDMLGHDEDGVYDIHVVADERSIWIGNAFRRIKEALGLPGDLRIAVDPDFVWSDHSPFWKHGYSAVMVGEESSMDSDEWPEYIHSSDDTMAHINPDYGVLCTRLVIAAAALLADPLPASHVDLAIESLAVPERSSRLRDGLNLNITVANESAIPASDVELEVRVVKPNGETDLIASRNLTIAPNQRRDLSFTYVPDMWGEHRVSASLNLNFGSMETNYNDNIATARIDLARSPVILESVTAFPNPSFGEDAIRLFYELSSDADVFVKVFDLKGRLLKERDFIAGTKGGQWGPNSVIIWDGRNELGEPVASGVYMVQLIATDSVQSSKLVKKICVIR